MLQEILWYLGLTAAVCYGTYRALLFLHREKKRTQTDQTFNDIVSGLKD